MGGIGLSNYKTKWILVKIILLHFVWLRKPPITGDKIIGNDGNEPFSRRIYNPASGNSGGIASETHAHSKGLFPAGRAFLKTPVKIKRYSRQITKILQQGK